MTLKTEIFVDAYVALFRAAVDQPQPSDNLKAAVALARNSALGLLAVDNRLEFAHRLRVSRAERLAQNLLTIYEDEE